MIAHDRHRRQSCGARLPQAAVKAAKPPKRRSAAAAARPSCRLRRRWPPRRASTPRSCRARGRGGRVTKDDVLAARCSRLRPLQTAGACSSRRAPVAVDTAARGDRPEQRVPMSRLRQRIAERLVQSQSTAAILTTFNEVNMQPVIELRNKYKDAFEKEHGVKLGFMSFFVKAAVHALKKLPGRQRLGRRQRHRLSRLLRHRHRGRQPARPGGADPARRRPAVLRRHREDRSPISASARKDGKLTIEELTGGTFSISNGGVFGSMLSTPIINPPQVGDPRRARDQGPRRWWRTARS